MSASNWATCPRCLARAKAAATRQWEIIMDHRADVPPMIADAALASVPVPAPHDFETFAEYYEIYGAQTGTVTVSYGASCEKCGLSLSFKDEHPIPEARDE